jgi:SAM-dependent methyltransferase
VLDVGFGYGRDLVFLARQGCRVAGVELSEEGRRMAEERLRGEGLWAEALLGGRFEDAPDLGASFDALLSHRVAHLLVTPESVARFARQAGAVLRPGGLLCVGVRNLRDLDPAAMTPVGDGVFEYRDRPGHRIRYWDDDAFADAFGHDFTMLLLTEAVEEECRARPAPCHLTVMVARKQTKGPGCG